MKSSDVWRMENGMPNRSVAERSGGTRASMPLELPEQVGAPTIHLTQFHLLPEVLNQMEAHALTECVEVCGLVYEHRYLPLRNISPFAGRTFFADPAELARGLFLYGEPRAIFHTHPNHSNLELSVEDRKLWYYRNSTMIVGCIDDGRLRWKIYGNRCD